MRSRTAKTIIRVRAKLMPSLRAIGANNFYDQIAWFLEPTARHSSTACQQPAGRLLRLFIPHVLTGLTKTEISWRISDHYPLWMGFGVATRPPELGLRTKR